MLSYLYEIKNDICWGHLMNELVHSTYNSGAILMGIIRSLQCLLTFVLLFQDTDLDLPPNSDITYELQDGDYSGNFRIDATSGEITLSSPLDYEAVAPSLNGLLQLHVAALDGGTPQLNGSALVLIHLQVK